MKKARETTATTEVQNDAEDTQEPVPAEDSSANATENEEIELPVDSCSTEFEFGSTAFNSGSTAFKLDIPD